MILANEILKSENFQNLSDISRELSYPKANFFAGIYFQQFGRKPSENFIRASY